MCLLNDFYNLYDNDGEFNYRAWCNNYHVDYDVENAAENVSFLNHDVTD